MKNILNANGGYDFTEKEDVSPYALPGVPWIEGCVGYSPWCLKRVSSNNPVI